jgi:branched-chain amino acid aminotransferase
MASTDALLGAGLYETVLVEDGVIRGGQYHLARMQASAATLGLPSVQADAFRSTVAAALREGPCVRITLHAGDAGEAILRSYGRPRRVVAPVALISLPGWYAPGSALREHKLTSAFHAVWGARRAVAAGGDEGLLSSRDGVVGETATANLFAVVGGRLRTPPVDGLLPGTARAAVLDAIPADQAALRRDELLACQGAFLTSATRPAVPVTSVDGREIAHCDPGLLAAAREAIEQAASRAGLPL